MDNTWLPAIFIIVELVSTSGPVRSSTCVTSVHSDGSVSYQLSQPPPYQSCETSWEDDNRTVIAIGSETDTYVTNLTNRSITLNVCLQRVTSEVECLLERVSYKTVCRVNCSAQPAKDPPQSVTCLGSWCPEPWKVLLMFAVLVGAILLSCVVYRLWLARRKRQQSLSAVSEPHDGTENQGSYSAVKTSIPLNEV